MTLPLHENRWVNASVALALLALSVVGVMYLAGYFYLFYIHAHPLRTTPLTFIRYWVHYGDRPDVHRALLVCLALGVAGVVAPIIGIALPRKKSLHGDARFATMKEIKEAGLLGAKGIILGVVICGFLGFSRKYLMLDGQLGVLLAAPPRSGKGAGFVNTNMLNWDDSAVVLDIRQESWRVTSGFRAAHGQECYLFNPLAEDGKTCQWNPLSYVNENPVYRINDLQKVANMLFPDPAQGDPFWSSSCRTLFLGLALYVFETDGLPKTIGEMLRQVMFGEGESIGEHWKKIIEARDESEIPLSVTCQRALYDFIFTSGNTQSSIRKTFTAKLELWLNPIVDAATSGNSFQLGDLRKRRISLYIGVAPGDLERVQVILNLLFQQILEENTRQMPEDNPELKHQLLLMMDEFTAIGKVPILAKSVSYLGGYNIRLCIVIQSPSQLRAEYGHDVAETIMTCMGAQITFAPREQKHAEEISKALGVFGMEVRSKSRPAGIGRSMGTVNESEHQRELLKPQEVKGLGKLKEIVFLEDLAPILCNKIRYFKDKTFKARLMPPASVQVVDFSRELPKLVKTKKAPAAEANGVDLRLGAAEQATSWQEVADMTAADVENVDKLELKDFAVKLDDIEIPGEPITVDEMRKVVDMFLESYAD